MKSPIKNFDAYTGAIPLQSPGSLRTIARRIKTRALRAAGPVVWCLGGFFSTLVTLAPFWPLWLAIDVAMVATACDDDHRGRVTMPRQDAATHASDVTGGPESPGGSQ